MFTVCAPFVSLCIKSKKKTTRKLVLRIKIFLLVKLNEKPRKHEL